MLVSLLYEVIGKPCTIEAYALIASLFPPPRPSAAKRREYKGWKEWWSSNWETWQVRLWACCVGPDSFPSVRYVSGIRHLSVILFCPASPWETVKAEDGWVFLFFIGSSSSLHLKVGMIVYYKIRCISGFSGLEEGGMGQPHVFLWGGMESQLGA